MSSPGSRTARSVWNAPYPGAFGGPGLIATDSAGFSGRTQGIRGASLAIAGIHYRTARSVWNAPYPGCTLHGSLASPAGRKKIAHRFIGGYERGGEASPARDERILPSLTGLVPRPRPCPPMNRWAIFFRPAGLAQMRVRCRYPGAFRKGKLAATDSAGIRRTPNASRSSIADLAVVSRCAPQVLVLALCGRVVALMEAA